MRGGHLAQGLSGAPAPSSYPFISFGSFAHKVLLGPWLWAEPQTGIKKRGQARSLFSEVCVLAGDTKISQQTKKSNHYSSR